ncbi:MAG: DUF885 domain-containing protein [Acidobacteria bacterium]|nr:DUF885 domain-containing protein [Acidobacteriota bacterium]
MKPGLSLTVVAVAFVLANASHGFDQRLEPAGARRAELERLFAEEWEYQLRESPELATSIGDYRYNDRWSDLSLAHVARQRSELEEWLGRFQGFDVRGLPEQDQLSHQLMVRNLKEGIEGIDLKTYEMPIDQFNGAHLEAAQLVAIMPFDSPKHYQEYLSRLNRLPRLFDQLIEVMKQGKQDQRMPPRYLLEMAVGQCQKIAEEAGETNAFGQPVAKFPDDFSPADRKRLHAAILAAVDDQVRPAYRKLRDFLGNDYAPNGRLEPGIWSLPGGGALYRFGIRQLTTTNMDPKEIHELGLREVARIEDEQLAIAKKLGFSDLASFRSAVKENHRLLAGSPDELLSKYRGYIERMKPHLPKLFGLLPRTPLEVRPMEEFRAKEAAAAEYQQGTPDGSRPGIVYINTSDYAHRSMLTIESTAYHEGIPGHHMQISIAETLPELPAFRRHGFFSAYEEGWALYAERLGKDIGFYQDPYSDYGRLSDEMLRAIRLVVDTGVHDKHWTRQQMVDFFHQHSSEDEPDLQAETDRYIAWPAQALGYKLGQLEILKLRDQAKAELGDFYDIRAFHDEILRGGALPLDVLDARVGRWISARQADRGGTSQNVR